MFHNFNIWLFDIYFREKVGGWKHRKSILKRQDRGEDKDQDGEERGERRGKGFFDYSSWVFTGGGGGSFVYRYGLIFLFFLWSFPRFDGSSFCC